jgi:hypothetical protein
MRGSRLVAIVLALLLAFGGRATAVINTYLNIIPMPMTQQGPVEEEEERHGKAAKNAADRRHRDRVPTPGLGSTCTKLLDRAKSSSRVIIATRVLPDHEADFRNGIGAPLRC